MKNQSLHAPISQRARHTLDLARSTLDWPPLMLTLLDESHLIHPLWGQSGKSVVTAVTQSHLYPQHLYATWVPHYSSVQSQRHTSPAQPAKLANAGMCRTQTDRNTCPRGCDIESVLQKKEDLRISDIKRSQQSEMHPTWDVWRSVDCGLCTSWRKHASFTMKKGSKDLSHDLFAVGNLCQLLPIPCSNIYSTLWSNSAPLIVYACGSMLAKWPKYCIKSSFSRPVLNTNVPQRTILIVETSRGFLL